MGKSNEQTVGYHYRIAYHAVLTYPIDAFLEFRAAEKTAWDGGAQEWFSGGKAIRKRGSGVPINYESEPATGPLTSSGRIYIGAPNLFGGVKDQGGIDGPVDIMFGEADQVPNPYLQSVFGNQVAAWRGFTTLVFAGGRFGAMNPMPQKPSYKVRKIINGWDEPGCWYPEKASVSLLDGFVAMLGKGWEYKVEPFTEPNTVWSDFTLPTSGWELGGELPFNTNGMSGGIYWTPTRSNLWLRRKMHVNAIGLTLNIVAENGCVVWVDGVEVGASNRDNAPISHNEDFPVSYAFNALGTVEVVVKAFAEINLSDEGGNLVDLSFSGTALLAMNPAHSLYYVRTSTDKGREPRANINDASLKAAADRLHAEGFGLCWHYDPSKDTPDSFEQRICRIIGGSFERSLTDGQWYLDLARGDYDIDSLPVIGDDDILEFRELPTTLDRAVNSVAVRYFDVERKETVITPAVRALGLIRRFGEIHETLDFPEIPTGALALRVAERELRAYVTPTRTFELVTTPRLKALRRNQYARLQSAKRGIASMACIIGSKETGTLKSGAIRWKISQDVYALPDTTYVEIEHGVDTTPPTTPVPVQHAKVFEAPYIDLVATLPSSELVALTDDAGFLLAVAADPGAGLSYSIAVQPAGGDYMLAGSGEWCPTTTTAGAHAAEIGPTVVALASVAGLPEIATGELVIWDDEWCRLDAIDYDAMEATLARGCADTVSQDHASGSRLWFYVEAGYGTTEYTDGEEINVKLLPETGTQQLLLDAATALPLQFAGRQARPYPPAALLVNGEENPVLLPGEITLTWAHRDRVLQADQLVDQSASSVGPEPGTTYTVRWLLNGTLVHTENGITGDTASYTPSGGGLLRIEVESDLSGLASWQMQVREFVLGTALTAEDGSLITTEAGQPIFME